MNVPKFLRCSLAALALAGVAGAHAQANLESGLIEAMKLNPETRERIGAPESAIEAYAAAGLINVDADARADYTSYFVLKKRTEFMGHTLVVIEHEYMDEYVGCCVSPGVGITVRVKGSTDALEQFAQDNGCSFADNTDPAAELKSFGLKTLLFKARYASLSCRERDIEQ